MNNDTTKVLNMLAELRKHMVLQYERTDRQNPAAVMKEADYARELETLIKSVDDILRPYAQFV